MSKAIAWHRALSRHQHALAAIVLTVLVAVFFNPVVLRDATFSTVDVNQRNVYPWAGQAGGQPPPFPVQSDQAQYSHPRQVFLDNSLEDDRVVPLWDPYTLGGHPFLASGPGLAYPPRLILTLLFDPSWTHDVYLMVHLFGAGMAMFALMKELRVGFFGALLAAVAWSFSAYSLTWSTLEPFAAVVALLPLTLLFVRRWHDRRSWPALLLAGLVLGLLYLGSSSELALLSFLLVAGYAGSLALLRVSNDWAHRAGVARLSALAGPFVVVGAALCVAAVGALPFVELMGRVHRATLSYSDYLGSTQQAARRPAISDFLRTFLPPATPVGAADAVTQSAFVGTLTGLVAVPAAFFRRPGTGFGRGATVITLLFIVGTPVTWIGYHLVPGLSSLNGLARSLFVWNLGVAVLGGIGLDAALAWLRRRVGAKAEPGQLGPRLLVLLPAVGLVCIAVTAGQLGVYGRRINPPFQRRDPSVLFPATPALAALRGTQGPAPGERRVLPVTRLPRGRPPADRSAYLALSGNAGQTIDARLVTGYENAVPDRTLRLWRYVRGEDLRALSDPPTTTLNLVFPSDGVRTELLSRLGIGAIFAPPGLVTDDGWREPDLVRKGLRTSYLADDGVVLEVVDPAPRASVVADSRVVDDGDAAMAALIEPGFDSRRTVILESSRPADAGAGPQAPGVAPEAVWLDEGVNGSRLSVTTADPGWLVLRDSWDPGWRATVNGRATDVERADFAFQAVRVPAGTSTVVLTYRPPEVLWGAGLSVVAVTGIVAVAGVDMVRRGRHRRRHDG